jgi:hypothetical protein
MESLIPIELFVPRHLTFYPNARVILFLERTVKNRRLAFRGKVQPFHTVGTVPPSMTYSAPVIEAARGEAR